MIRRPLLAVFFSLLALPALAQGLSAETKSRTLAALQAAIQRRAFVPGVDFAKLPAALEKRKPELDRAETPNAFAAAVNLALRDFGISHIRFQTPAAARQRATGQVVGFGLSALPAPDGLAVASLAAGSNAEKIGLKEGDMILEVEGKKPTSPADMDQDGRETSLLTVKRKADGKTRFVMLVRKPYSTDRAATLTWPAPGVARIMLPNFTRSYKMAQMEQFLTEAAKAKTLILDLRNNGGGQVNFSTHLLSLLLPPGTPIGVSVTRQIADEYTKATGKESVDPVVVAGWKGATRKTAKGKLAPFAGKLVVLINRRSASASEIVSSVLREQRGAVIVGQNSAGAVLTSIFAPLPEGFAVQLPISDFVTPKGVRLEKNPVKVDVIIEGNPAKDEAADLAIQAALKLSHPPAPSPA